MTRDVPTRAEHPRRVVVGVDGSEQGWSALAWAADEASLRGAVLRVLYSHEEPSEGRTASTVSPSVAEGAEGIVGAARSRVAERHPSLEVRAETTGDRAPYALIEASCSADLLVVGARGLGGLRSLVLGSVSQRCIRYAHCPVVVVRLEAAKASRTPADRTIVVGTDGSLGSTRALRWALREGRSRGTSVRAVFAWQYPPVHSMVMGPDERQPCGGPGDRRRHEGVGSPLRARRSPGRRGLGGRHRARAAGRQREGGPVGRGLPGPWPPARRPGRFGGPRVHHGARRVRWWWCSRRPGSWMRWRGSDRSGPPFPSRADDGP